MKLHKEGRVIMPVSFLIIAAITALLLFLVQSIIWLAAIVVISAVVFFALIVRFFRVPVKDTPTNPNHVISPCDGKVVVIEDVEEPEYFKGKRKQVSIFMSPLNVHVNYYPVAGEVVYQKYHSGKYLVAFHPKSSTENERTTVVVNNGKTDVLFRQIAGAVARRIVCYAKPKDTAVQGDEFGFIKFGSRIDLYLPLDAEVNVNLEQKVIGAETVIATI